MSEQHNGGDISSGFGESKVDGPVSDEKAEQMLHGDKKSDSGKDYSEQDAANNEQDLRPDDS